MDAVKIIVDKDKLQDASNSLAEILDSINELEVAPNFVDGEVGKVADELSIIQNDLVSTRDAMYTLINNTKSFLDTTIQNMVYLDDNLANC